mmetsp:Transcript_17067/g.21267  ORF Transcript_17067/g.21267 Transcript_17067/m.21267 type:complete len:154 (+) Transcript_17067:96-557(+)
MGRPPHSTSEPEDSSAPLTPTPHDHELPSKADDDAFDAVSEAIQKYKPAITQIGLGGVVGYCSGCAAKTIGKAIALLSGVVFIGVQSAVYTGYVDVDWDKVKEDVIEEIDTDGDGEITTSDFLTYWRKLKKILTNKVPSASGFSLGFLYGLDS